MSVEEIFFTEIYRPRKIKDCILPDRIRNQFDGFIEQGKMPNLLLTGPPGTGKTTVARALSDQLNYELMFINGSDEGRVIGTIRTTVTQFASSVSLSGKRKVILFDEFDNTPDDVQKALLSAIEKYSKNCSFIFTANMPNRILPAIHSRTSVVDFTIEEKDKGKMLVGMLNNATRILDLESVKYDKKTVANILSKFFPDFRKTLNELQRYSLGGKIDEASISASTGIFNIDGLLKILADGKFKEMVTWVETTPNLELTNINRIIYKSMYKLVKNDSLPELVLILADYDYKDKFVADKQINIVAMCTEIISRCEFLDG